MSNASNNLIVFIHLPISIQNISQTPNEEYSETHPFHPVGIGENNFLNRKERTQFVRMLTRMIHDN